MTILKSGAEIPEFESEAQEAAWWDDHKTGRAAFGAGSAVIQEHHDSNASGRP